MISTKKNVQFLAAVLLQKGITDIVISPGSRNAPLINTFTGIKGFHCINIVDERSAAFFALGIALIKQQPVAVISTSGTAVLNYAPAVAEAFYQKIPLLLLTADRPKELIDQGDGQTIRQENIYRNYIKNSYSLILESTHEGEERYNIRMISEAVNDLAYPEAGPVHINIPLAEPLYELVDEPLPKVKTIDFFQPEAKISSLHLEQYLKIWSEASKKLIIAGQQQPDPQLMDSLIKLDEDPSVAILAETTSNISNKNINTSIDNIIVTLDKEDMENFRPELLVTVGGQIISKKIKAYLRQYKPKYHWHLSISGEHMDTFSALTHVIPGEPHLLFDALSEQAKPPGPGYKELWLERDSLTRLRHKDYLSRCEFTDLKVFEQVLSKLPSDSMLHLSNSTPVRYAQLFPMREDIYYLSNRGTSGIDGVVSTAAGTALATNKITTLITGDLAFFYDSNALWNHHLTPNFKIIMINNGGGGIFRFIDGPETMPALETHFEARHHYSAEHLTKAYDIAYFKASDMNELEDSLGEIFGNEFKRPVLLEIFTPAEKNAEVLKNYFRHLDT